jgi:hypothetical protein
MALPDLTILNKNHILKSQYCIITIVNPNYSWSGQDAAMDALN